MNSETPAWLLDRMSILMLKIFHMKEQAERKDASADHIAKCSAKLSVLLEQKNDMRMAFDELVEDIQLGNRIFKVYRQMKMYNDDELNPVLYQKGKPIKLKLEKPPKGVAPKHVPIDTKGTGDPAHSKSGEFGGNPFLGSGTVPKR